MSLKPPFQDPAFTTGDAGETPVDSRVTGEIRTNNDVDSIPDYARIVLVPVANPRTAGDLLDLALAVVHPEEGRVIALLVSTESLESQAEALEKIKKLVKDRADNGRNIELQTETATSISRGILDAARENGADMVILGIRQPKNGEVVLGTVAENVLETAPTDVLVYRGAQPKPRKRIVVLCDGSIQSRATARTGIRMAKSYALRIEAVFAQDASTPAYQGRARIEQSLNGLPGEEMVRRRVYTGQKPSEAILSRLTEDDITLVGFSSRSSFERIVFGDVSGDVLNRAEGPVILVRRALNQNRASQRLGRRLLGWVRPALTRMEQEEVVRQANVAAGINIDYVTMILVSAMLATLGLLLNSAAVIIGAMLVAPFLSPLTGLSVGITTGTLSMMRRAVLALLLGVGLSLLVALTLGLLLPSASITPEMTSRGSPTLLDAAVALAAGIVGAYATARKDIPAALAGVAIAAALMPPLCTVGLGIALSDMDLAFGAMVLFLANIASIITVGAVIFRWLGINPRRAEQHWTWPQSLSLAMFVLFVAGVGFTLLALSREATAESLAVARFQDAIRPLDLVEVNATDGDPLLIQATVRSAEPVTADMAARIEREIEANLGRDVLLEIVVWQVVLPPEATMEPQP